MYFCVFFLFEAVKRFNNDAEIRILFTLNNANAVYARHFATQFCVQVKWLAKSSSDHVG